MRWCLRDRPDHARFLLFHGDAARGALSDGFADANQAFFRRVAGWWKPHVRYGAMRDLDFDLTYALWLGPAQEFCRLRLTGRTTISSDHAEQALADGAWLALKPQGAE
jgi:hypothetical protein